METIYTYSKISDFPGGSINSVRLTNEIDASSITKVLLRIDTVGDAINIVFDNALSAAEKTTLDGDITGPAGGLIALHDSSPLIGDLGIPTVSIEETRNPSVSDCSTHNIVRGTLWFNTITNQVWICTDDTIDASVWIEISSKKDSFRFSVNGRLAVENSVDGTWISPYNGNINRIAVWRGVAGTGGSTIVDINKNGTTIYTTQGNRPTITSASGANAISTTTPDILSISQNDRLSVDIDAVEVGNPKDLGVIITVEYF